jgi:hypothetical protein
VRTGPSVCALLLVLLVAGCATKRDVECDRHSEAINRSPSGTVTSPHDSRDKDW